MKNILANAFCHDLSILLATDQPVTCPFYGIRTNWLADFSHTNSKRSIHECSNHQPEYLFIIEDDEKENAN